ncbi:type III-A CRISPR-associated protein Cas10/Csm1 [Pasteurella atlantica]|uniref:type III-A CRISPR-associated protein Cas10/Csm1 n=1 Tax=Pasteurellaceae TaxID=712 RepID=UPI00275F260F|nr:type III-A CRISPR-associated protein Cas10/Csm1 [Pasteurella atlantica]MDP8033566.1 type III-A CRISPR-associated protein Cas10/Csm1 [Pasteurella atlantica]MDP8035501.1 type III-A CRISPR-associated protein Cas10/Csm1 [Pasteurella atlantica]MDP8037452.1 type III-A CRISPR-associated protein Cas10/Csm1 [Pasteurella atlantica]MDP8047801.1 type III-A CRISPR-associated protein Cas10/Csm1 [Pasteurella atlantica]MDP8049638.1 type III-A CRISPR-associated protein Cas10/Csm1 [Pasteurella atlantica]
MTTLISTSCQVAFTAMIYHLEQLANETNTPFPKEQFQTVLLPLENHDFLRRIIDRAQSITLGSDNDNNHPFTYSQEKLYSLFKTVNLSEKPSQDINNQPEYAYPLEQISADNIFPKKAEEVQVDYANLWTSFFESISLIPADPKQNMDLWLDHFDTLYQCFMSNIPSRTYGVPFYDYSKTITALATALWRWHNDDNIQLSKLKERNKNGNDDNEKPFLLISGDFFGVQEFIFAGSKESNKQVAKLLRGRSFQVSLFTELAALKILQTLELPSTSQILNAAGKFLIIAPNTQQTEDHLKDIIKNFNQWFIQNTCGLAGIGIATTIAGIDEFEGEKFKALQDKCSLDLEKIKLQRLGLTTFKNPVQDMQYSYGCCKLNQYFPALEESEKLSLMSKSQIKIGENLVKKDRLFVCDCSTDIKKFESTQILDLDIFGYKVVFTSNKEETGELGDVNIHRFWDFSLPKDLKTPVWNGYARRYINGYVSVFDENSQLEKDKYQNIDEENKIEKGVIKTFDYLACEDRKERISDTETKNYIGQSALMTLKGDVDNLGSIFKQGLGNTTLAKMTTLSRQMNQFFSLWLPAYCNENKENIYTVFAGGDDFFLIGSWHSTQKVAFEMQKQFKKYVANNEEIHFSVGMVMSKVDYPVSRLGELAEETLEKSKEMKGKNAVTIFDLSVSWNEWDDFVKLEDEIKQLATEYNISTSYLYSLIHLSKQAEIAKSDKDLTATMWRSHFYYKTARYVVDKLPKEKKQQALERISKKLGESGIAKYDQNFQIPLFNYFYKQRK